MMNHDVDPFHLERFVDAQSGVYERVLDELRRGQKSSHWMWFIFPQVRGLGHTETSIFYAISSADEAIAYLEHRVLGPRLRECCDLLLQVKGKSASQIFGSPDDLKLRSSMTLFALAIKQAADRAPGHSTGGVTGQEPVFRAVIERYFEGRFDSRTVELLAAAS